MPELPESDWDQPLGLGSGAGVLFGTTGGVMEAALRTVREPSAVTSAVRNPPHLVMLARAVADTLNSYIQANPPTWPAHTRTQYDLNHRPTRL